METHPPSLPYQTPFLCWHPATTCTPLQPAWDDPLIPLYSRGKAVKVRLTPSEPTHGPGQRSLYPCESAVSWFKAVLEDLLQTGPTSRMGDTDIE